MWSKTTEKTSICISLALATLHVYLIADIFSVCINALEAMSHTCSFDCKDQSLIFSSAHFFYCCICCGFTQHNQHSTCLQALVFAFVQAKHLKSRIYASMCFYISYNRIITSRSNLLACLGYMKIVEFYCIRLRFFSSLQPIYIYRKISNWIESCKWIFSFNIQMDSMGHSTSS